ncbi:MAG: CBS domain-containing protein [Promethearchaeota archaeon]
MMNLPTPEDLKRYRKMIGLTQQELAERASVSQSLIARIETGTVDPRISTVRKILRVISNTQQKELKAIDVAVKEIITVQETELVSTASKLMFIKGFSQIPVCNAKGSVIGSLKEKTITKNLIEKGIEILSKPISEIMNKDDALPMLPISSSLRSVEDLLVHHGHSAVLLMDEGEVVGILTKADVIRAYIE